MILITALCLTTLAEGKEPRLPGSSLTPEVAAKQAELIVVAKVTRGGVLTGSANRGMGASLFEVETTAVLKGKESTGQKLRKISFTVEDFSLDSDGRNKGEGIPEHGQIYILFIIESNERFFASKIMSNTAGNVEHIRRLASKQKG